MWYWTQTVTADQIQDILDLKAVVTTPDLFYKRHALGIAGFDIDKIIEKGKQTKRTKANVSFGKAEYHYDFEF